MKQHLTIKQLNELSDKGKKALAEWIVSKHPTIPAILIPAINFEMNIGQLIEFLDDRRHFHAADGNRGILWGGRIIDELCDDLWKEVKEILEKE